ncbi:LPS export ABC transporter permease LptF [Psychrobium sp. 1_MG-2023]|uniref:LPS export ABC transporter permease LptF n=1 Tax=Psychrobium sp. 1_MG-2023 TaxID=3062624 RepID=UPI000C31ECFB|nr:LPS export ABC transporter permease LptF [Psychrobium sp. 1_MG-2023]MDP2559619.1 LPS export ABC transporter permease LptF [Psychrobium sp. 1_MG-2023]PKF59453.1 LPS export ABC transporter permease LptF [Alteromonadales bacterium alter-6D02]
MIIFSYLIREALKSQLAVLFILMSIFLSQKFVRILADAVDGDLPGALVATLLALNLPKLAGLILPLSLFLGILMAHSRMYADSEMTVMHATGISEWYVTRITLVLAFIMMVIAGLNSIWLGPWAQEKEYQTVESAQADAGISTLSPGRFQYSSNKKAVIYVESIKDGQLNNVFVAQMPNLDEIDKETGEILVKAVNGKSSVVIAQQGKVLEEDSGSQQLELSSGKRYQGQAGEAQYSAIEFANYQMQIKEQEVEQRRRKLSAIPMMQLIEDGDVESMAEVHWRLAIPLTIPMLTLIAVPLARVNPRQGKFAKLFPAIMLFLGYYVMLMAGRSALEDEVIPMVFGLWWIHISALVLGLALLMKEREFGVAVRARLKSNNKKQGSHA